MKTVILLLAITAFAGCYLNKELQVELVNAQLVRIDTIYRYRGFHIEPRQQLTWKVDNNVEYISYEPLQFGVSLGTRMLVLKTR